MFKVKSFVRRREGMTAQEFRDYYETRHVALAGEVAPPPLAYQRNYLLAGDAANINASTRDFDVVTEMEFADRPAFERWQAAIGSPENRARMREDLANFSDPTGFSLHVVEVRGR